MTTTPEFRHSFALFDVRGRLVDWDSGLEIEWALAAPLIARDALYGEIIRAILHRQSAHMLGQNIFPPADLDTSIDQKIAGFGKERSHTYVNRQGQIVLVEEHPTASGGIRRVARDVTREKEAESQVELMKSVVVRSSDSIVIFQTGAPPEGATQILYVNATFERLFGVTTARSVGRDPRDVPVGYTDAMTLAELCAFPAPERPGPVELQLRAADGAAFWIKSRTELIQKFEDGSHRWVAIARDISDRRRTQLELLQAKEAAEAASRTKSQFLANMSHELRTPLNAVIGFSELIEQGVDRGGWIPTYGEYLRDIGASGRHLLSLINSILDLSKIEAGALQLSVESVDVRDLIEASIAVVCGLAIDREVELEFHRPSGRPEIAGDFVKLKQVLLNLLSNAIKFTPAGGKIDIAVEEGAKDVAIVVTDTGCGMSEADLKRVGRPFVQIENTLARKHPGTGLGLSIAKQLCDLHHGALDIRSVEGQGTVVRVTLPRLLGGLSRVAAEPATRLGAIA